MKNVQICPFCLTHITTQTEVVDSTDEIHVHCHVCGTYGMSAVFYEDCIESNYSAIDKNKVAAYLYYHKTEKTFPCLCVDDAPVSNPYRCVTFSEIETWYPKKFFEKIDLFLLMLESRTKCMGHSYGMDMEERKNACFVIREHAPDLIGFDNNTDEQARFFMDYLEKQGYIYYDLSSCTLSPEGFSRVDELQKNSESASKNVFVAMSFSPDMQEVREAIKSAILDNGYTPRIMDEIEHNHQIVPEMLYEIRQARFVVAELTGHNNGAYFEAGYALGCGKEVIQICRKDRFGTDGHFDVKQINTILWDATEELSKKLSARIKATIE